MKIYNSAEELIGKTPLVRLKNIEKHFNLKARIIAKAEGFNPAGSVKDRVAKAMLDDAMRKGLIKENTVIIEPTSGNTGIGLASVGAARGLKVIIVMPDSMSVERQKLMTAYGADLVLTDGKKGMSGAIQKAEELAKEIENSIIAGQFVNPANPNAHFETTGPEIYEDTDGEIDIFVAGIGTGGTITGTGKYLKSKKDVKVVGVEPLSSPFLTKGESGAHEIQGIGAGFKPEILDTSVIDEILTVSNDDAISLGRLMGTKEGLLVGISAGAALCGAIELAKREENHGKNIVVLLPDTGDRYLSTRMF
ncbi:MAG: cysteine synthase A [Clostridia bacterium]|nr:cysteine synthase A [Clostridia bacterium]